MRRSIRNCRFVMVLCLMSVFWTTAPTRTAADDGTATSEAPQTLSGVGVMFENALLRPAAERAAAMDDVAASLSSLLKRGLPGERKSAARFSGARCVSRAKTTRLPQTRFAKHPAEEKRTPSPMTPHLRKSSL